MKTSPEIPQAKILSPLLKKIFETYASSTQLSSVKFNNKLKVAVLESQPHMYVTDGYDSIQVVMANSTRKEGIQFGEAKPYNKNKYIYYLPNPKAALLLNCNSQQILEPISEYSHPYEPYFYFGKQYYQMFKIQRLKLQTQSSYETLTFTNWKIKVVNVGATGYYGVVLEVYQYFRSDNVRLQSVQNIYSIIYQGFMKEKMEQYRLIDIRKVYQDKKLNQKALPEEKHNLCYFLRNSQKNVRPKAFNNLATIDHNGQILSHNKNSNLVVFGDLSDICYLHKAALQQNVDSSKWLKMNEDAIKSLFNIRNIKGKLNETTKMVNEDQSMFSDSLWSDSDEREEKDIIEVNEESYQELEESDSDQDPLKKLYQEQIRNLKNSQTK